MEVIEVDKRTDMDKVDAVDEKQVTIGEVKAAFDALLEVVGRECDVQTAMTVFWARDDVLRILRGEWIAPGDAAMAGVEDVVAL
jgi:hypothetical protein